MAESRLIYSGAILITDRYMRLDAHITEAIATDDYDQSDRLADIYLSADEAGKDLLDRAFICLCWYQLKTLMSNGDLDDITAPGIHRSAD
jgi:hypothetical protein